MNDIDTILRGSAPPALGDEPGVRSRIEELVRESRASFEPWTKRLLKVLRIHRVLTTVVAVLVLGVAPAAAIATSGLLHPERFTGELVVDVSFVTSSGDTVACSATVIAQPMRAIPAELARFDAVLRSLDWRGMAQETYADRHSTGGPPLSQVWFASGFSDRVMQAMRSAGLSVREMHITTEGACEGYRR